MPVAGSLMKMTRSDHGFSLGVNSFNIGPANNAMSATHSGPEPLISRQKAGCPGDSEQRSGREPVHAFPHRPSGDRHQSLATNPSRRHGRNMRGQGDRPFRGPLPGVAQRGPSTFPGSNRSTLINPPEGIQPRRRLTDRMIEYTISHVCAFQPATSKVVHSPGRSRDGA